MYALLRSVHGAQWQSVAFERFKYAKETGAAALILLLAFGKHKILRFIFSFRAKLFHGDKL